MLYLKKAYEHKCLSRTQIFEWLKTLKEVRETTEDDVCSERPCTSKTDSNVQKIDQLIRLSINITTLRFYLPFGNG